MEEVDTSMDTSMGGVYFTFDFRGYTFVDRTVSPVSNYYSL
jgi:hypothetical protein